MKTWRWLPLAFAAVSLGLSACGKPAAGEKAAAESPGPPPPPPAPPTPEQAKITSLLTEIVDMTRPRGCTATKECKSVGVGYGGCGPRQYIVYCPRNVDEARLRERLDELTKLEQAEAARHGEPPPCRPPPTPEPEAVEGVCRAKM